MSKIISKFFQWATGKTVADLSADWQWYHFLTRSRVRAYWLTLIGGGSGC